MVGIVSSLKLQKSTVKLQFGFIVSNVSPLFHLASDNKGSINYLKIVGIKQQWPVSTDNSCQWFRTTTHRCDWIGKLRSGDLISGIVQYMLIGVRFNVNWWARGREWPNKIRRAIVDCLAFLYLQGLKVIEWISRAHSVYKDGHRFWFVAYPSY